MPTWKTITKYTLFTFFMIVAFTVVFLIVYCVKDDEPETLIQCFYTCMGTELLLCMVKAIANKKAGGNDGVL